MQSISRRFVRLGLFVLSATILSFSEMAVAGRADPKGNEKKGGRHQAVLRSQALSHDFSDMKVSDLAKGKKVKMQLKAFSNVLVNVDLELKEVKGADRGLFVGKANKDVEVLASRANGAVVIDIFMKDRHIQISPTSASGDYIAEEYEPRLFPSLVNDTIEGDSADGGSAPSEGGSVQSDVGTVVDVLVVFAKDSANALGGQNGALAFADNSAEVFNQASINGQIGARLRVVSALIAENYMSSGSLGTDLDRLIAKTDGHMDEAHPAREHYGADLVALISESRDACGLGYMPGQYTATNRGCAVGNKTFAHEVGHNFGCGHGNGDGNGSTAYANGHRFYGTNGSQYRTIMAYAPGTRITHFSNPNILYQGTATGVKDLADNARRIVEYAPTLAKIRTATETPLGSYISFSSSTLSFGSVGVGSQKNLSLTITNQGSGGIQVESLTFNGGVFSSADQGNCLGPLAGFASCKITVTFSPAQEGNFSGSLAVKASGAENSPASVSLTGSGVVPSPSLVAPSSLSFPNTSVGSTSSANLNLSNNGTANLLIESVVLVNTSPFSITKDGCSNVQIEPGKSCTVSLSFASITTGTFSDKVTVRSNDPKKASVDVTLSGSTGSQKGGGKGGGGGGKPTKK